MKWHKFLRKSRSLVLSGALGLLIAACSNDTDGKTKETFIDQEMAWNSIKDEVLNNTNGEIEVWGSNAPIRADSVIQTYFTVEQSPHYLSWLFFIDDRPFGNWSHPCRYIYVNVLDGIYEVHYNKWPPKNQDTEMKIIITPNYSNDEKN